MNHTIILENAYHNKCNYSDKELDKKAKSYLDIISVKSENQKGVFTVLVTLLVHKIHSPLQDIRLHQSSLENGFSGRSIDTKFITPYLKKIGLPSMAESGWLTRSLEQPYPYDLNYNGKISDKSVREAFLNLIDLVQNHSVSAQKSLEYLLYRASQEQEKNTIIITPLMSKEEITILQIYQFLEEQFFYKYKTFGGARLPVIAFHTIYELICLEHKRYNGCSINPLGNHTASDKTSNTAGDIEVIKDNKVFEAIEIKLDKEINFQTLKVAEEKIYRHNPKRYYILSAIGITDNQEIDNLIKAININHGCQIIVNGLLPTLKYYLRLIESPSIFIDTYLLAIANDKNLKKFHKEICNFLIEKHFGEALI